MSIKVYNTLRRKKQDFVPGDKNNVKMYVCGPTVYNYISIGNARPVVVFNMIRNYLENSGFKVKFVQNITDIEDKIIRKANKEGVEFSIITEKYIKAFYEDLENLEIGDFFATPLASEMITEIILIIEKIVENGFGYVSGGDVYFDVSKFKGYGKLSGQNPDEMQTQEEDSFSKKHRNDFTLWKSAKPGEPCWNSPWSNGRPGWHIECSAMSMKYFDFGLDIHGGGIDLVFPHHENEIAQSEAAFPNRGDFVRYWMHNGMIEVRDEKMSKSKGLESDWILRNLLKKYSPDVIKAYMLSTHYRSPLEFSIEKIKEAKKALEKVTNFLRNVVFLIEPGADRHAKKLKESTGTTSPLYSESVEQDGISIKIYDFIKSFKEEFKVSMDDDFNSARAIGNMFDFIGNINSIIQSSGFKPSIPVIESLRIAYDIILKCNRIFGIDPQKQLRRSEGVTGPSGELSLENAEIEELIEQREFARRTKDFRKADEIRQKLKTYGIILEDRKEGTIWKREN
ncbi:MAG: cysteine--tRNA ligase [Actinobacteria bacterium]|nr:cysteine--tRNA ligase [Actinomycetota bacterium]